MARGEIHVQMAVDHADDPKMMALNAWPREARAARDLYWQMVCYAKRTLSDGFIPASAIGRLSYPDSAKVGIRQATLLAEVGLIKGVPGGWDVAAFLKRNPSRAEVDELSQTRSQAGRLGGKRSGMVRKAEATTKQVASIGLNTESESETESETEIPSSAKPTAIPRSSSAFDEFWLAYPRRVGKVDAQRVWLTASKRADPQTIIDGAKRYRDDPNREEQFTAHPATWLRRGGWDDEPLPSRVKQRSADPLAFARS